MSITRIHQLFHMSIEIKISLNQGLFLKEPQDSKLGRKIMQYSIEMIDDCGFEFFTFKKLAIAIHSTEASIYRYFENKHMLLLFLMNWYWERVCFLIHSNTNNNLSAREKLKVIVRTFVAASKEDPAVAYVNESKLHNIVISEGNKAYHTKEVDLENSKGFFKSYKNLAKLVSEIILEVNPDFKYPYAMATNLFEMSNSHIYFAEHLPKLTDISTDKDTVSEVESMLNYFIDKLLT